MEWEHIKRNVYPVLLPQDILPQRLESKVWQPWLDLAVAYVLRSSPADEWWIQVWVTEGLLRQWGITSEKLKAQAMENLRRDGYHLWSVSDILASMASGMEENSGEIFEEELPMLLFTNQEKWNGAAGILQEDFLQKISDTLRNSGLNGNFYIIPSSIHEVLLVPDTGLPNAEMLNAMVRDVNQSQVPLKEQLADHIYYYCGKECKIRIPQ